jgi:hypothetical protein
MSGQLVFQGFQQQITSVCDPGSDLVVNGKEILPFDLRDILNGMK